MVEAASEFVELVLTFIRHIFKFHTLNSVFIIPNLCDSFGVSGQNLVLNFVNISIDGGEQLFPSYPKGFHCVLRVSVFKNHAFLH